MVVGDKITKVIGIENEGLKRLFLYIYKIGLISGIFICFVTLLFVIFTTDVRLEGTMSLTELLITFIIGTLSWTPVYLLILMIGFRLFINPILFIIEGFKNEKK